MMKNLGFYNLVDVLGSRIYKWFFFLNKIFVTKYWLLLLLLLYVTFWEMFYLFYRFLQTFLCFILICFHFFKPKVAQT